MNKKDNNGRRSFLKTASIAGIMSLGSTEILEAASLYKSSRIELKKDDIILFQGDSITDSGRKRDVITANNKDALGTGYAFQVSAALLNKYPEKNLQIYNRGISGNKVYQLADRWDKDCLEIKPTILSILIGVNDYWHKHDGKYNGTPTIYRDDLKKLLERTKQSLPDVKLIIAEPFAVKGVKAVDETWYPEFNEIRQASLEVAKQFNAVYIPLQKIFDNAINKATGSYWTGDGVHPSIAGAALMAEAWMETIKG